MNVWSLQLERYRSLAPMYYRGAGAAIVVYDITSRVGEGKEWLQIGVFQWSEVVGEGASEKR